MGDVTEELEAWFFWREGFFLCLGDIAGAWRERPTCDPERRTAWALVIKYERVMGDGKRIGQSFSL